MLFIMIILLERHELCWHYLIM